MNIDPLVQFIKSQDWTMFGVVRFEKIKKNLQKYEKVFQEWVRKGFDADMDYLKRMQGDRFHPERKLGDIRSVIVLTAVYSNSPESERETQGVVARYARGKDYHKVLKKKLVELASFLNSQFPIPNPQFYSSVDSGPTVDRVLAESAGLGFFGKNSCIIDPSRGSYFFIASVYTNFELEPTSAKHMPNCGDCQKCMKTCPTGAIIEPGVIDARKCISYLTIENKGPIPEGLRSKIGNRIFGCDACQEVCPFNIGRAHHQQITIDKLKSEYGAGEYLDLKEVLSIKSDDEFTERFAGTPLMRAKRRGLLRNACIVAGNSGNKELVPYLEELIKRESDEMVKEHAEWALKKIF